MDIYLYGLRPSLLRLHFPQVPWLLLEHHKHSCLCLEGLVFF